MQIRANLNTQNKPSFNALYEDKKHLKKLGQTFMEDFGFLREKFVKQAENYDIYVGADLHQKRESRAVVIVRKIIDGKEVFGNATSKISERKAGLMAALKTALSIVESHQKSPANIEQITYNTGNGTKAIKGIFAKIENK